MEPRGDPAPPQAPRTAVSQWRSPHEVAVFVRRGDRYLLMLRSPRGEAYWHVVAGAREAGETNEETALRELEEETGLRPTTGLLDLDRHYSYAIDDEAVRRFRLPPGTRVVEVRSFVAEAPDAWEPTLNAEHTEHRWCTLSEALSLVRWADTRATLEHLRRIGPE